MKNNRKSEKLKYTAAKNLENGYLGMAMKSMGKELIEKEENEIIKGTTTEGLICLYQVLTTSPELKRKILLELFGRSISLGIDVPR